MQAKGTALTPDDRDFVAALASGLDIILAFDSANPRMTLSEVATKTGMNRARARRFLLTLHSLGYVRRQQRYFELAPRALKLGYAFLSANSYRSVIQQHLEDITDITGESSSLGVLDKSDVFYVARSAATHRIMTITLSVGTRLPAVATSMGRVLLAQLPADELATQLSQIELTQYTQHTITDPETLLNCLEKVRADGYCIVDQELDPGLRSLAVPVFDANDKLLGAINISTNTARVDYSTLTDTFLSLLQEKAGQIRTIVT